MGELQVVLPTNKFYGFYDLYFDFLVAFLVAHNEHLQNRLYTVLVFYIQEA